MFWLGFVTVSVGADVGRNHERGIDGHPERIGRLEHDRRDAALAIREGQREIGADEAGSNQGGVAVRDHAVSKRVAIRRHRVRKILREIDCLGRGILIDADGGDADRGGRRVGLQCLGMQNFAGRLGHGEIAGAVGGDESIAAIAGAGVQIELERTLFGLIGGVIELGHEQGGFGRALIPEHGEVAGRINGDRSLRSAGGDQRGSRADAGSVEFGGPNLIGVGRIYGPTGGECAASGRR